MACHARRPFVLAGRGCNSGGGSTERGSRLRRVRGVPLAGAVVGFGDLLAGHSNCEGVACLDRQLAALARLWRDLAASRQTGTTTRAE